MQFLAERSESGGIEGPWTAVGRVDAEGDEIGVPVLNEVAETAGLYRIRPVEVADQGFAFYWLDAGGRIERRHFPGLG